MQGAIQNKNSLVAQVRISHSKLDIQPFKNNGLGHNFSFQFMLGTAEQFRGKILDRGLSALSLQVKSSTGTACGAAQTNSIPSSHIQNSDFPWWTHGLQWRCQVPADITTQQSNDATGNSKPLQRPNEPTKSQVPRLRMRPVKLSHLGFSLESWALKTHLLFHGMRDFYPPIYPPHQTPVVQSRERSR